MSIVRTAGSTFDREFNCSVRSSISLFNLSHSFLLFCITSSTYLRASVSPVRAWSTPFISDCTWASNSSRAFVSSSRHSFCCCEAISEIRCSSSMQMIDVRSLVNESSWTRMASKSLSIVRSFSTSSLSRFSAVSVSSLKSRMRSLWACSPVA